MQLLITNYPTSVHIDIIQKREEVTVCDITRLRYRLLHSLVYHYVFSSSSITESHLPNPYGFEIYVHKEIENDVYLTNNFDFLNEARFGKYRRQIKTKLTKACELLKEFALDEL